MTDVRSLPPCVVAHLGRFLDLQTRRSCICAHRCLVNVMETYKGAGWALRPDADYAAKARALARLKPHVTELQLSVDAPAAADVAAAAAAGWPERQGQALADALVASLPGVHRVTVWAEDWAYDDATLSAFLRALVAALPPHIPADGAVVRVRTLAAAVEVAELLQLRLGRLVIGEDDDDDIRVLSSTVLEPLAARLEALVVRAPAQSIVQLTWLLDDFSLDAWTSPAGKRTLCALRSLSTGILARQDSTMAGLADEVYDMGGAMLTHNVRTLAILQRLASNTALRTWALNWADLPSLVSIMDDLLPALRTRPDAQPTVLLLYGVCVKDPGLPAFLRALLPEADCDVRLRVDSLVDAVVARRTADQLQQRAPDLRPRVHVVFTADASHLEHLASTELESQLLAGAQAQTETGAMLQRWCRMLDLV